MQRDPVAHLQGQALDLRGLAGKPQSLGRSTNGARGIEVGVVPAETLWRTSSPEDILFAVIIVQRVRVRWGADARGAMHANRRRNVAAAYSLPWSAADERFLVHEVLAGDDADYQPVFQVGFDAEAVRAAGLDLEHAEGGIVVARLPGRHVYPASRVTDRLFTLQPSQMGRYRANFRFTDCACAPYWYYEAWTVHIAYGPPRPELFMTTTPDHDVDLRVHLYGGRPRRSAKQKATP